MWKLGNLEIKGKVILAPMAGITSEGYRKYMNSFGCDLCYTEMVSDMGILYGNKETEDYVRFEKDICPTGVQLFGNNHANLAKAAVKCLSMNPNIAFFDINMGCPVNKVTKPGSGSSIMRNPKLAGDIIRAMKEAVNLPVTAKIRLGYDEVNFLDVIKELENANKDITGIFVQLPLPTPLQPYEEEILQSIAPNKDVDGFTDINVGRLHLNKKCLRFFFFAIDLL